MIFEEIMLWYIDRIPQRYKNVRVFVMSPACLNGAYPYITTYDVEGVFNETTVLYSLSNWRIPHIISIITFDSLQTWEHRCSHCLDKTNEIENNKVISY